MPFWSTIFWSAFKLPNICDVENGMNQYFYLPTQADFFQLRCLFSFVAWCRHENWTYGWIVKVRIVNSFVINYNWTTKVCFNLWVKNDVQNEIWQPNFDTAVFLRLRHHKKFITLCYLKMLFYYCWFKKRKI